MGLNYGLALLLDRARLHESFTRLLDFTPELEAAQRDFLYPDRFLFGWHHDLTDPARRAEFMEGLERAASSGPAARELYQTVAIRFTPRSGSYVNFGEDAAAITISLSSRHQGGYGDPDRHALVWLRGDDYRSQAPVRLFEQPIVHKIIELLEPFFGFSTSGDGLYDYKDRPLQPWRYYWDTMVFGPELAREYRVEDALVWRSGRPNVFDVRPLRGPAVVLMSPLGIFGNESVSRTFETDEGLFYHALRSLVEEAVDTHREVVTERLQLIGWNFKP